MRFSSDEDAMTDDIPGTRIAPEEPGQVSIAKLTSNRTMLVLRLNARGASKGLEVVEVKDLAGAVVAFAPETEFQLQDAVLAEGGKVALGKVTLTMTYGANEAARVVEDFSPEALVGKAVADDGNEVERRVLLRQRLQSQVIEELVSKLRAPQFAEQINDPSRRQALLDELDKRIAEIGSMKDEIVVGSLSGDS